MTIARRQNFGLPGRGALALAVLFGIAACTQAPEKDLQSTQLQWARAALERNEALEVVAVDRDARVFTVRERTDGALHTVALDDLVAGPAGLFAQHESAAQMPMQAESATVDSEAAGAGPEVEGAARTAVAVAASPEAAEPARDEETAEPASTTEADATTGPQYTVERSDGRVRVSGPGFSITSAESSAGELELAAERSQSSDEPIICEGNRMMHIDGRTLDVDGDAVIARNGCDLHITNSRIRATGVAVTAIDAKVHVTNSALDGGLRSLEIADGGKAYLRSSTLDGIVQRFGAAAELHDLGGNAWE